MKKVLLFVVLTLTIGLCGTSAMAQSLRVSGKVTYADDGQAVIGAVVTVEGTNVAAATDANGMYQLTVPSPAEGKVLNVSYAGLASQTRPIISSTGTYDFSMATDALSIENVVVTGYGSARKVGTVVGSVEQVKSDEIENRPTSNVMDALQGKVAGLTIYTSSGEPGEGQSIRLHGVGSLGTSSDPLYILDGIQVTQATIQAMNSNDFESISVLKDASATSIYGSRAANGVIVYTTKRGVRGDAKITVNGYYGVSTQASTDFYDNLMDREQLWDFWEQTGIYGYSNGVFIRDTWTAAGYAENDTEWYRYYNREFVPVYSGDISISGGNEKTNYYVSGGVYSEEGTAYGSYYDKLNFRSNINTEVKPWLKMGANLMLTYDNTASNGNYGANYLSGGMAYMFNPMYSPTYYADADGKEITYAEYIADGGQILDYWDTPITGTSTYNPEYLAAMNPSTDEMYGSTSSAYILIEPIKNLKIQSRGGLEFLFNDYAGYSYPSYTGNDGIGGAYMMSAKYLTSTITNTIEYGLDIKEDHNLNFLVGHEGIGYTYSAHAGYTSGLINDDMLDLGNGTQSTYDVSSGSAAYNYLSFFGQVNYSYKNYLYADLSIRNDSSSRFSTENKSATFWAAGLMVNLKNLLLEDNQTISNLSAKVSYGTQGNSGIGNYAWQGTASYTTNYQDNPAFVVSSVYNGDLQWETQTKFTVAANISLWNRLNVGVEFYNRETQDMLMSVPQPGTTGTSSLTENVGGMRNRGVDVSFDYYIFRHRDYWLNVGASFNYNKQTITELFDGKTSWTIANTGVTYVVGQSINYYYPIFAGIDPETGAQTWYETGEDFTETNTTTTTTEFSETDLTQNTGKALYAPVTGGFSVGGGWKGLSLTADFTFSVGKWMLNNDAYFTENPYIFAGYNTSQDVANYWQEAGDIVDFPDWSTGATMQFDTHLLENASFLRLKNLSVGYQIPATVLQAQSVINGVKVYATARNLLTFTQYTGVDPEVDSNLSIGAYPNTKQFILGIELIF
ncbi:MAG: SusC/RagA family TonB-linked outer membrane protein [Rikenellaceae bacterium]